MKLRSLLLAFGLALAAAAYAYQRFATAPMPVPEGGTLYTLEPGRGLRVLGEDLARQGLIPNPAWFWALGYLEGRLRALKAGEYAICPGTSPRELLRQIEAGRVVQYPLTLVEGWTFAKVMETVRADDRLEQELSDLSPQEVMARLGFPNEHPEGRFFPDTYRFPRGTSDLSFLRRAFEAMREVVRAEWAGRAPNLPLTSPDEAIVLASIVEKETAVAAERPQIAGVFVRRLQKGMRLQTDPTVIYGLGEDFDGNLRRKDLEHDGPYNTYTRAGLPPTPIALPGRAAIHAALHPAAGEAIFFVARGDGTHAFSASLAEHNEAVRRFQLKHRGETP